MSLTVEVAGYGLCQNSQPYSLYVVCVQQESFPSWNVFRRYSSFLELSQQVNSLYPDTTDVPIIDGESLSPDILESSRIILDKWLRSVISNLMILRTQSMYQFLCADANLPPPYLEIHWRNSDNGSFDEMVFCNFDKSSHLFMIMCTDICLSLRTIFISPKLIQDMDDMFEAQDAVEYDAEEDEVDETMTENQNIFDVCNPSRPLMKKKTRVQEYEDDGDEDGMDIKSLSVVEAEFLYDRVEDTIAQLPDQPAKTISLESFHIIKVIGKGSYGKVFLVREKATGVLFAMKVLKKDYIIKKNQVEHTKTERSVLGNVHHPYIVGMAKAFQTSDKLFFVLDYCAGGELFFHLGKVGRFPEERAKFYAAQITLALQYVHSQDIIYRDLKPENVLLDAKGNVRLTDFGLSKEGVSDHSTGANSFCGTPEYIAPEVLLRLGHGRAVDWWSLGALLFEMITGLPPFYSRNRETMFEKIMKAELVFPPGMSEAAKDILSRLLVRDPNYRLGSGETDAQELKSHPFFSDVDWNDLEKGNVQAPWAPAVYGSLDTSQFDAEFTSMNPIVSPDVRGAYFGSLEKAFEGFSFVDESAVQLMSGGSVPKSGAGATLFSSIQRY